MIAKIVKGSGFREVTGYIIDSKKNARIIAHAGLFIEREESHYSAYQDLAQFSFRHFDEFFKCLEAYWQTYLIGQNANRRAKELAG